MEEPRTEQTQGKDVQTIENELRQAFIEIVAYGEPEKVRHAREALADIALLYQLELDLDNAENSPAKTELGRIEEKRGANFVGVPGQDERRKILEEEEYYAQSRIGLSDKHTPLSQIQVVLESHRIQIEKRILVEGRNGIYATTQDKIRSAFHNYSTDLTALQKGTYNRAQEKTSFNWLLKEFLKN